MTQEGKTEQNEDNTSLFMLIVFIHKFRNICRVFPHLSGLVVLVDEHHLLAELQLMFCLSKSSGRLT